MKKILTILMLLAVASPCFGRAYYAPKKEMIQKAECIAIVTVTQVEKTEIKMKAWTYRQKAKATVERTLKGGVKGEIEIIGMEEFICAQCRYEKGRFLLFLTKVEGFWIGTNWQLGIRPIMGDKVQWFKDETRFDMAEVAIGDVIDEINVLVKEQKKETP